MIPKIFQSLFSAAEDLQNATTMIGEDGTQYIIVMDENAESGEATAIAVSEASILPQHHQEADVEASVEAKVDDDTVYVVDDGHGNYQLVDPTAVAGATTDAEGTLVIDPASLTATGAGGGVQFIVDEDGNLLVDEEGHPFRMAVDEDGGEEGGVKADAGVKYVVIEDEHGQQMVVDASTLMGAEDLTEVDLAALAKQGGSAMKARPPPRDVVTKRVVNTSGGPLVSCV